MTTTEKLTVLAGLKGRETALTWAPNKCMCIDIINTSNLEHTTIISEILVSWRLAPYLDVRDVCILMDSMPDG